MGDLPRETRSRILLLVYYSGSGRERIRQALRDQPLAVCEIDGRSIDAVDVVRRHPAKVLVMDYGADDVSLSQAIRQVGQILPDSLVLAVFPNRRGVDIYQAGHRVGKAKDLETALGIYACELEAST